MVAGTGNKDRRVPLPAHLLPELRISLIVGDEVPAFELTWPARQQVEEAVAQDFKAVLIEEIGDAAELVIGTFTP